MLKRTGIREWVRTGGPAYSGADGGQMSDSGRARQTAVIIMMAVTKGRAP